MRRAESCLRTAEHIIKFTYPLVNDEKLLLSALERANEAVTNILKEVTCSKLEKLNETRWAEFVPYVKEIRSLIKKHRESPVEFSRKGDYVICDDYYNYEKLSYERVNFLVGKIKEFKEGIENGRSHT